MNATKDRSWTHRRPTLRPRAWLLAGACVLAGCDPDAGGREVSDTGPPSSSGGKGDDVSGLEIEVIVSGGGHDTYCFSVEELESVRDHFAQRKDFEGQNMPALQNLALALLEMQHYVRLRTDELGEGFTGRDQLDCVVGGATVVFLGPAFGLTSPFRDAYDNSYVGDLFFRTQDSYYEDPTVIQRSSLTLDPTAYSNGSCQTQWRDAFCDNTNNQIFHTWFFVALTYTAPEQDFASALTGFANAGHEWGLSDDCWFRDDYSSGGCTVADWDASRWGAIYGMVLRAAREEGSPDDEAARGAFEHFAALTGGMLAEPSESEQVCQQVGHYPLGDANGNDIYGNPIVEYADCDRWVEMTNVVSDNFNVGMLGDLGTQVQRLGIGIVTGLQTASGIIAGACCDTLCGWIGAC